MRTLSSKETRFIAGADMVGNAMIRIGTQIVVEGHAIASKPAGTTAGLAIERTGQLFVDAGNRRNDTTSGGPPGGDPNGG